MTPALLRSFESSHILLVVNTVRDFKASVFQVLGHTTRLQIIEALHNRELPVGEIIKRVGRDASNISQHLASLRLHGLVVNRKEGSQVFYAVRDPLLFQVLALMRRYATAHVQDHMALLRKYRAQESRR